MGIIYDQAFKTFHLQAKDTSYVMQVVKDGYLAHLYWGQKIQSVNPGHFLVYKRECSLCPNPDPLDRTFSLDTLPQEYPAYGNSDFRHPAYQIQHENGTTISELKYHQHWITKGKPKLDGLPATYTEKDDEAETLELELLDPVCGLKVTLFYTAYENFNVITRAAHFENQGLSNLKLLRALSMSIDFPDSNFDLLHLYGAWARERYIERRPLIKSIQSVESKRGASSPQHNPFIALLRPDTSEEHGEVYGFNFVYSGNFIAQAEVDQNLTTRVSMGINPFDFSWFLEPSQSFQTPEVVMVYSSNGIGQMSRTFHKLYRTRLCRGVFKEKIRPILINNWEATFYDFNTKKIENIAKIGKELGIELLVLDDGWFGKRNKDDSSLGDWYVYKEKLPEGLDYLANRVNQIGMQFGLWFEPEMVSPDSELYREHPDWCLHVPDYRRTQGRYQLILDFSRDDVCEAVRLMISKVLSSAPISYVKWDMNRNMTEIGSAMLPPERQRETAHRYILGLYKVLEKIIADFPDILFESCASGGGRFDPGMLYYMPQIWASDDTDAIERLKIQYGTSIAYPVITIGAHVSAIPNHQVHRITPLKIRGDVAMSGNFGFELDLTKLTETEKELIKGQIAYYKEIRHLVQFGDFYRLISPFENSKTAWMFVSEDKKEAILGYFKVLAEPNEPIYRLRLKGLNRDLTYFQVETGQRFGGDELLYAGLIIPRLQGDFNSIFWRFKAE